MKNLQIEPFREKMCVRNGIESPIQCLLRQTKRKNDLPRKLEPHYHEYIEFLIGREPCDVTVMLGSESFHLGTGDMLIIHANVPHDFDYGKGENEYICIKILPKMLYFSETPAYDLQYVAPFLQHNLLSCQFYGHEELKGSRVPELANEILDCWERAEYGYEIAIKSLFLQLFLWITRYNHEHRRELYAYAADISYENAWQIQKSLDFINENYADITEADAAAYANMSYSYYSKLFRRAVGKNFNDYLTTVRINAAERLLISGNLSVTEIAHATGFATSSHFIETFKKLKKTTPKQYRLNWGK